MKKIRLRLTAPLLAAVLLLNACNSGGNQKETGDAGSSAAAKPKIAVIPKGSTHSFWKSIHAGAEKAAQETGAEVIWQGPQKEDDRQMQIQV
ncbi:MAG: sugar ABC transporter substrate-binding protein, partial [Cytophagales bacterium]|nr:sugar ABC transporter substrate-binding protein [Cytophagales bacterium]